VNLDDMDGADEEISVVAFPQLRRAALQGTAGEIVNAAMPHTEAHPAAVLVSVMARFGATIGDFPHVFADNRTHPARINPLIVGKTSDGAKGTAGGVSTVLFSAAEGHIPHLGLRRISGLSSGEGLIETVRDGTGDDPNAKNFDEGVADKRLLIEEPEFTSTLAVMDRNGSILPRVLREAWDGDILRTTTRSPLVATGAHIVMIGHVTPGELKLRMSEAQMLGGTMNRFITIASRRTKLLPDGGNIPPDVLNDCGKVLSERIELARRVDRVDRTAAARDLWHEQYANLRRARPDGSVAKILARAVPQVLRLSLIYALLDGYKAVDEQHLVAALALWDYASATADWMFGGQDSGELEKLVVFISEAGKAGRTKTEINEGFFRRNTPAAQIDAMLASLISDGRVRQEKTSTGRGRPSTRFYA
jgi:hypothetical protein